jgi:hypothetical protein
MNEKGEFERVADTFEIDSSVLYFQAQNGSLSELNEELWNKLENTDSNRFEPGNWSMVEQYSGQQSQPRDWGDLKQKLEKGTPLDAPIVMKFGDYYHLVSGNTRLMVARAMGITPSVWLF